MTTEEKIQYFLDETMMNARKQAYTTIEGYYAAVEKMLSEYQETKKQEAELQINAEKESMQRAINKEVSAEQILIRKELSDKQNELEDKLFDEVGRLLDAYMKTDAYKELLLSQINAAKAFAGEEGITIYIDPKDVPKKETLERETGCELTVSSYSFVGGTRAVTNSGKILIDNSFETGMKEEREKFVFQGGH